MPTSRNPTCTKHSRLPRRLEKKLMASEAVLGPLDDSDRLGLETLLPGSPSPGPENYRCPASTPSHNFRRDLLSAKLRPQGRTGGFTFGSPSPSPNRRFLGRFSGGSVRRSCLSRESEVFGGDSALRRKTVEYYYVDKSWQRRQAAQTNTTWLKSLCSQPVDEILRKYRRKSELQKSKMLWSKTYSTPGERALLHAWESNVTRGMGPPFPPPPDHAPHGRGGGGGLVVSQGTHSAERVKGASMTHSHVNNNNNNTINNNNIILNNNNHNRSEPSLRSSHYGGDDDSSMSQAEDHPPPPPPPSSAVWAKGRGGNGQGFIRVPANQRQGGVASQRLPSLSNKEKAYMFRQRKFLTNGGRGYSATLDSGGVGGGDSRAGTITVVSEDLSQVISVEPSPRLDSPARDEGGSRASFHDVRLPHIGDRA